MASRGDGNFARKSVNELHPQVLRCSSLRLVVKQVRDKRELKWSERRAKYSSEALASVSLSVV